MHIFDSNVIIYAARKEYSFLRPLLIEATSYVSIISKLEVLGFHGLTASDETYFNGLFSAASVVLIDEEVIEEAIRLRQVKRMSVGDAIIAATALLNGFTLYTRNTADFAHIAGLTIINPIEG